MHAKLHSSLHFVFVWVCVGGGFFFFWAWAKNLAPGADLPVCEPWKKPSDFLVRYSVKMMVTKLEEK